MRADKPGAWLRAWFARGEGPLVFHVAEGTGMRVATRSSKFLRRVRRVGPLVGVHGISLNRTDAEMLDALVWCPASNQFLFERTADIAALRSATSVLFGTDASISAEGTIWSQLRLARSTAALSDEELFASTTENAARIWGIDNREDLVVARCVDADRWNAFFSIEPADIQAVVIRGRLVLVAGEFAQRLRSPLDTRVYRSVRINGVRRLVFANDAMLEQLAAVERSPLKFGTAA